MTVNFIQPGKGGAYIQTYDAAALGIGTAIAGNGTATSSLLASAGYSEITASSQLTTAGTLQVQRYLDAAGTITQGTAVTAAITANVQCTVNITADGLPWQCAVINIINASGSTATISHFSVALSTYAGAAASGGGGATSGTVVVSSGNITLSGTSPVSLSTLPAGTNTLGTVVVSGTSTTALSSGSANIGTVAVSGTSAISLATLPAGTNTLGTVALAASSSNIGTVAIAGTSTTALSSGSANIGTVAVSGTSAISLATLPAGTNAIGTVSITGTSPVSLSTLPSGTNSIGTVVLGAGSATIGTFAQTALPAGTNNLGTVVLGAGTNIAAIVTGNKKIFTSTTPTITAGTYAAGTVVGGALTFTGALRTSGNSGYLMYSKVTNKLSSFSGSYDLFLFSKPLNGTYTDNAVFNLNGSDIANILCVRHVTDIALSGTGAAVVQTTLDPVPVINAESTATSNIYGILVNRVAVTQSSTSDITVTIVVDPD